MELVGEEVPESGGDGVFDFGRDGEAVARRLAPYRAHGHLEGALHVLQARRVVAHLWVPARKGEIQSGTVGSQCGAVLPAHIKYLNLRRLGGNSIEIWP